jgi:hypothetical protein
METDHILTKKKSRVFLCSVPISEPLLGKYRLAGSEKKAKT